MLGRSVLIISGIFASIASAVPPEQPKATQPPLWQDGKVEERQQVPFSVSTCLHTFQKVIEQSNIRLSRSLVSSLPLSTQGSTVSMALPQSSLARHPPTYLSQLSQARHRAKQSRQRRLQVWQYTPPNRRASPTSSIA